MCRTSVLAVCIALSWAVLLAFSPRRSAADPPPAANPFDAPGQSAAAREDSNPFGEPPAAAGAATESRRIFSPADRRRVLVQGDDPTPRLEAKIRKALSGPTIMDFVGTPLQDAIDYLKDRHEIEIQIDHRALEEAGIGSDTPITRNLSGVSLASALRLLLDDLDATFVVRDGTLLVTSKAAAGRKLERQVYNVKDLVGSQTDAHELAEVLRLLFPDASFGRPSAARKRSEAAESTGKGSRDLAGSGAAGFEVVPYRHLLVVQASQHDHQQLAQLLAEIKAKLAADE